ESGVGGGGLRRGREGGLRACPAFPGWVRSGDRSADGVAEWVADRISSIRSDVALEECFDVEAHRLVAGVLGDADDWTGAAERRDGGRGVGIGECAYNVGNVGDLQSGAGEELSE